MKNLLKMLGLILVLTLAVNAPSASAVTNATVSLTYSNLVAGSTSPFVLPKFDPYLGNLQSISLKFNFSGTVSGTASGITQSSIMNSTVTRWVFFNFTDTSDNVFIAEPSLALPTTIPTGAQSATISFGPQFQSTSNSWTVTNGDPRFNAWANGPGNFTGTFKAYFTTTAFTFWGLQFYSGIDSGLYNGSLSITYNYVPIRRDSDGDGLFDDEDECPNTPPGAIVDEHGCSIDQLVPCEGPKEGGSWKNHGQYVSTFGKEITKFVEEGRINETEAEAMAELAAQCDCGKKR